MGFCLFNNIALAARHAQGTAQPDAHPDRRLGRAPRQRHPGHLLRRPGGDVLQHSSLRHGLLSRHRRGGRDRQRQGPGLYAQRAQSASARRARIITRRSAGRWRRRPTRSSRSWCSSVPASTPMRGTRSARSGWRSRISPTLTRAVLDVARTHAKGRLVSCLEGGYNPDALAESVQAHLDHLL